MCLTQNTIITEEEGGGGEETQAIPKSALNDKPWKWIFHYSVKP